MMNAFLINKFEADIACDYLNEHISRFNKFRTINRRGNDNTKELNNYWLEIIDFINHKYRNDKDKKEFIESLKKEIINQRLSSEDLIWIDKSNTRLCNWLYVLLKKRGGDYRFNSINIGEMYLGRKSYTNIERYNSVINILTNLYASKDDKIEFINRLKKIWSEEVVKYRKVKDLINKNNINQTVWAYEYIEKTFNKKSNKSTFNIDNDSDYYHIIICYFDSIENHYEKNDKFTKLKNAWSQKKYREDNNGKKSYSFNMSIDIAKKLDILSENSNRSKNYIVEELIKNEYLKLKK
ncbi:hypothetical protein L4D04_06890 [Photobacterium angustum]|uniref:hypothetical protein n=1 Tax=Photobacterium angustum TaxID=661 RepID=UPI003D10D1A3